MARKEIKNPMDDGALNSTNHNFIELYEGKRDLNKRVDNIVNEVSDEALDKVVNNAKINWKDPVDNYSSLPSVAEEGDTRMDRSSGKVYRFNGTEWKEIQQIDVGPVNELDSRLSSQLADITSYDMRVLFVSDLHYTGFKLYDTHENRIKFMVKSLNEEHEKNPITALFITGDLGMGTPEAFEEVVSRFLPALEMPYYVVKGNHDHVSDDKWSELFGYDKNYSVSFGDYAFICINNYASENIMNQDYTPTDLSWFNNELSKYTDKNVLLVTHRLLEDVDKELVNIINSSNNILAVFQGHLHVDDITKLAGNGKPLINNGQFSYTFGESRGNVGWNYRELYTLDGNLMTEIIYPEKQYPDFYQSYERKDIYIIKENVLDNRNLPFKENKTLGEGHLNSKVSGLLTGYRKNVMNNNFNALAPPRMLDGVDRGYSKGSRWICNGVEWVCTKIDNEEAVWTLVTPFTDNNLLYTPNVKWIEGRESGLGTQEINNLKMIFNINYDGNQNNFRTYVTSEKIDFTDINYVQIKWILKGTGNNVTNARVAITDDPLGSDYSQDSANNPLDILYRATERKGYVDTTVTMDCRDITGEHYLSVGCRLTNGSMDDTSELMIYQLVMV